VAVSVALLLALASAEMAFAQSYPTRPVNMIVPFPAGRAADTLAQFPAETMRPVLVNPS
jgi:tripartite-type tricarboxylate transporter receptor subunit TctC